MYSYGVHAASTRCEEQTALPDRPCRRGRRDVPNNKINQPTRVIMVFPPCNNNYIIVEGFYELLWACRSFYLPFFVMDASRCAPQFMSENILLNTPLLHCDFFLNLFWWFHLDNFDMIFIKLVHKTTTCTSKFNKYIECMTRPTKSLGTLTNHLGLISTQVDKNERDSRTRD